MQKTLLKKKLIKILNKNDIDIDSLITRKLSNKHCSRTEILLEHIGILVQSLIHDNESLRRELKEIKDILEFQNDL
jgi:hypothetical protein